MTWRSWLKAGAFTSALALACSDGGTSGALGNVSTSAHCAPGDQVCVFDGLDAPLAVGATLPLSVAITTKGFGAPPLTLVSASTRVFDVDASTAIGRAPGFASLLVLTPEGIVLDFVTLSVEAPTALRFHRLRETGALDSASLPSKIQMMTGDDLAFAAKAYAGERRLLGELDATWTSDDALVRIVDDGTVGARRVVARAAGTTTLGVSALGLKTELTLEVLP